LVVSQEIVPQLFVMLPQFAPAQLGSGHVQELLTHW
jgi:hypothetical protein